MPRIDPIELLKCLSVLLSPHGGIKSGDEVRRLASLMTKFSKKLVSKCIYIQILKCTDTNLLGLFMASGGWKLVHIWLTESIASKNSPLVKELLELLLLCPVDIERLKTNNCPKLVKELSKDGHHLVIRALASKLVEQWLKTVKGENVSPIHVSELPSLINDIKIECNIQKEDCSEPQTDDVKENQLLIKDNLKEEDAIKKEIKENDKDSETLPVLKISVKDGKQFISQLDDVKNKDPDKSSENDRSSREKSSDKNRSSKSSSRSHSSSSDKHKHSNKSSGSSSSSKNKERSSEKDKNSSRISSKSDKEDKGKRSSSDKHRSSSSHKSSRHDKKDSSKIKEKLKDEKTKYGIESSTKSEVNMSPIQKLGKIPKLSDSKKEKPSLSIEVRKPEDPKPKTVKTFHSKFRKHGLEEEVKPPPSRAALLNKKPPPPPLPPTVAIPKRPSPAHNESPPEKKAKILEPVEKPGSIKLIPAKHKPMLLLESDMFMDALNASATNKKEPKKRKRRTSGSKDGNSLADGSPPHSQGVTSPTISESKSVPPRFYQDTLETEDDKDKSSERESDVNDNSESLSPSQQEEEKPLEKIEVVTPPHTLTINGLKGVLCYHKRKGPKKSIKWKPDSELEEVQYFELDETERVNVTKTFTDMKHLERVHERESFQKARNLSTDDVMEERTAWRPLILIETEGQIAVEYGKLSKEKDIQAMKQKGTLQPLYLYKSMIPDSPLEPPVETHTYNEPTVIPLEDVTGNQDNVSDFRNMPWPDPKGNAPPQTATMPITQMFQPPIGQFPNTFPNQFPGVPPFQGPGMVPSADWPSGVPPMMAASMPPGSLPPGAIPPGVLPPGMMPDNMMLAPDMFGAPNPMFSGMPPEGFNMIEGMNMPPNMFTQDFNMMNGQGPPGADSFGSGFRGAMRGRGSSAGGRWNRGKGSGGWEVSPRGRGGSGARGGRKQVCIYFQRKGSCRQGDNCTFLHPGVNCPF